MSETTNATPKPANRRQEIANVLEERRRWIRVDLKAGLITASAATPAPDVAVMEVSPTGLRIASVGPVPVDAVFESDLRLVDGTRVHPRARVVSCRPQRPDGHDGGYVSRLEFVDGPDVA